MTRPGESDAAPTTASMPALEGGVAAGADRPAAVEARALTRAFGDVAAVRDVTFRVARGEVVGFLGHNGAGKSTTLRMLAGVLEPTSGEARIDGVRSSSRTARARVGFLAEMPALTAELTVEEQLGFAAGLRAAPTDEVERVLHRCDLVAHRKKLTATLSRGTRQRVGLAQALIGDPPVLLLDEPTAGLDPGQAAHVRELIATLGSNHAIVFSSHVLSEVRAVCNRVLLLRRGALVMDSTIAEVERQGQSFERAALEALGGS